MRYGLQFSARQYAALAHLLDPDGSGGKFGAITSHEWRLLVPRWIAQREEAALLKAKHQAATTIQALQRGRAERPAPVARGVAGSAVGEGEIQRIEARSLLGSRRGMEALAWLEDYDAGADIDCEEGKNSDALMPLSPKAMRHIG